MRDFDFYEIDLYLLNHEVSPKYDFDDFKSDYPDYLDKLNNHIRLHYNTYALIHSKRFFKLKRTPEYLAIAKRCGFGMLLRHALEASVTSIATENGIEVGGRSVSERLEAMKGQNIHGIGNEEKATLSKLLDITNSIAHPHVIHTDVITLEQMTDFYNTSFKPLLESYIQNLENRISRSKQEDFGLPKEIIKGRKQTFKYLVSLKKNLDNINVCEKKTNILIQGCLVRQLTECAANLWCYNHKIVPTDASTFENQINLGKVLEVLARIGNASRRGAFGTTALTSEVISNLFKLKNASNSLMHVEKFASNDLVQKGKELSMLYNAVKSECSPQMMNKKLNDAKSINKPLNIKPREKSPFIAALLCGVAGWLGAHHFYLKNISKGIWYLITLGFIIRPALDLLKIAKGQFRDRRGFRIRKTFISSITALVFLAVHCFIIYNIALKIPYIEIINYVNDFKPVHSVTARKVDDFELYDLERMPVIGCLQSSSLVTEHGQFDAIYSVDGDLGTSWQEGAEGNGEGESLEFILPQPERIAAVSIYNGKFTDEASFYANARAKRIIIEIGGIKYPVELDNMMQKQSFRFLYAPKSDKIKFTVDSAYPGDVWSDLCISELEFYK